MRIDDAGPRTWLLATIAGWALLAWLLAVAGMGGRIDPLADDPALLKPLPTVPETPPARLGPLGQYAEISARPLFAEDRRPHPFFVQGQGEQAASQAFDYQLTGVLITPDLKLAILQPPDGDTSLRVRLGEAPEPQPDWRLIALNPRSAVFEGPEGRRTLDLRVFDGVGGAAPTAIVAPRHDDGDANANGDDGDRPAIQDADEGAITPMAPAPAPARKPETQRPAAQPTTPDDVQGEPPMTDQAQMEAIRERIQQRRARLRGESEAKPPAQSQ